MNRLDGKVAIVTGAGCVGSGWGNGRATAALLARDGAAVFLLDIVETSVAETADIIRGEGGTCEPAICDMLVPSQVERSVRTCLQRFGRVDILVNNVGGSEPGAAADMPEEVWDQQIDFNLKSAFLGCKYVLPPMIEQRSGAIVNLSSVAGLRILAGRTHVAYTASKAGIIALSKSIAITHARDGIRCNTVVPGLMHTPLVEARLTRQLGVNDAATLIERRHAQVPMGHMGDAWDVAHAVRYLVSDEAKYVTATEIVVDGGLTAASPQ